MNTKHWLESLTIQGQLVAALPSLYAIARLIGLDLPDGTLEAVVNGISAAGIVVGSIMTVIGRWRANKSLTAAK